MSLRNPKQIRYTVHLDELDKDVSYRALKVGEQKSLLTIMQLNDPQAMVNSLIDIVNECTFKEHDISKFPMHIVDFLFLQIYIKSSGSMAKAEFTCAGVINQPILNEEGEETGETETVPCGSNHLLNIDLGRTVIKYPDDYASSSLIDIDADLKLKLRVPSFEVFKKMKGDADVLDVTDAFIFAGIECIIDGDTINVPGVDFTFEYFVEWMNELDSATMAAIQAFYEKIPHLFLSLAVTCPKCGRKEDFELDKLEDFFV